MKVPENINKQSEYLEFCIFLATFEEDRELKTQLDFAAHYKLSKEILTIWKQYPETVENIVELRKAYKLKTPVVLSNIYRNSKKDASSQKLWMQVIEGFAEKSETKQDIKLNDMTPKEVLAEAKKRGWNFDPTNASPDE